MNALDKLIFSASSDNDRRGLTPVAPCKLSSNNELCPITSPKKRKYAKTPSPRVSLIRIFTGGKKSHQLAPLCGYTGLRSEFKLPFCEIVVEISAVVICLF